jgi:hypothetical protein
MKYRYQIVEVRNTYHYGEKIVFPLNKCKTQIQAKAEANALLHAGIMTEIWDQKNKRYLNLGDPVDRLLEPLKDK